MIRHISIKNRGQTPIKSLLPTLRLRWILSASGLDEPVLRVYTTSIYSQAALPAGHECWVDVFPLNFLKFSKTVLSQTRTFRKSKFLNMRRENENDGHNYIKKNISIASWHPVGGVVAP